MDPPTLSCIVGPTRSDLCAVTFSRYNTIQYNTIQYNRTLLSRKREICVQRSIMT